MLILHGTTGNGEGFLRRQFAGELFGPGDPLDTATHFIILPDGIGTGTSTTPGDGLHAHFPHYGYHDMIAMGAMQTWMWGEAYPEFMAALFRSRACRRRSPAETG